MGTIINPTPAATMLEEQRLGYVGCSLTNFDSTAEPQIVGNAEVAGSLASFASAESITGWSALSNGDVYIKVVHDTGAGTVSAEFTDTAPTWDTVKNGWYGTGAAAPDRYLFKLNKTGASGYEDKTKLVEDGGVTLNGVIAPTGIRFDSTFKMMEFDIGVWDMETDAGITFLASTLGITVSKIRHIVAWIWSDGGGAGYGLTSPDGYISLSSTTITLRRIGGEFFDGPNYNSTTDNRGTVYIVYTV